MGQLAGPIAGECRREPAKLCSHLALSLHSGPSDHLQPIDDPGEGFEENPTKPSTKMRLKINTMCVGPVSNSFETIASIKIRGFLTLTS